MVSVWCFTVVRNEEVLMPYFMRHYKEFCSKIIVYDDHSTDNTRQIVWQNGGIVRDCPWSGLDDIKHTEFAAQQYKEARGEADWVIWVDADEFIWHRQLTKRLLSLTLDGVTLPRVQGYSMVSDHVPDGTGQIYDEIRMGFRDDSYGKQCVFSPLIDIIWSAGKHEAYSLQSVSNTEDPLKLFHYRYLDATWHKQRNERNYARLDPINIARQHGIETYPGYEGKHSSSWYQDKARTLIDCIDD